METTVQKLATELSAALTTQTRNDGDKFVVLKDGSPQWMTEVIHAAHGDKMPDDVIYSFIGKAADAMAECDEDADEDALREAIDEIEPPVYTHEQMKWFSSNWEYCDQAIEEGLWESHTDRGFQQGRKRSYGQVTDLVAIGMQLHIREIGNALLSALTERVEQLQDETNE